VHAPAWRFREANGLDYLVTCTHCDHGATLHAGDGCGATRCGCPSTRETIIEGALQLAKRDIHEAYRNSPGEA
jgi:hypothetical protein